MLKRLILALMLAALTACATPARPNTELAYQYEALAALQMVAAQSLSAGTLSLERARRVQFLADQARMLLDAARTIEAAAILAQIRELEQ